MQAAITRKNVRSAVAAIHEWVDRDAEVTNDGSSRTHTLYPPHPAIAARWINSLAARDSGRGNSPSIGLLLGPALDPGLRADVAPRGASADGRSIDDRTVAVLTSVRSSAG